MAIWTILDRFGWLWWLVFFVRLGLWLCWCWCCLNLYLFLRILLLIKNLLDRLMVRNVWDLVNDFFA